MRRVYVQATRWQHPSRRAVEKEKLSFVLLCAGKTQTNPAASRGRRNYRDIQSINRGAIDRLLSSFAFTFPLFGLPHFLRFDFVVVVVTLFLFFVIVVSPKRFRRVF